ncbi:MAG: hypothetical protein KUL83_05140 [Lentimicrobium sp.]|nr:hypothetical protein [Lentimicrobium sp.]
MERGSFAECGGFEHFENLNARSHRQGTKLPGRIRGVRLSNPECGGHSLMNVVASSISRTSMHAATGKVISHRQESEG